MITSFWPLFPVRKDLIEKFGNNWWRAGTLVSSGPFIFSSFEPGKSAVLKKNPFYKKTAGNIDEVNVDFILSNEEAMKKYESKYYPFILSVSEKEPLNNKEYHRISLLRHYVLATNSERFPFNNKFFRLAILSSIDRKRILPESFSRFKLTNSLIPSELFKTKEDLSVPYDLKKAKEYLEKSGCPVPVNGTPFGYL